MSENATNIMLTFLTFNLQIKMFHFQTPSYSRHKISDELFESMLDKIDEFMEVLQGSWKIRVVVSNDTRIPIINMNNKSIITLLREFTGWLVKELPTLIRKDDVDLLAIRDTILADINKTLYLLSFS